MPTNDKKNHAEERAQAYWRLMLRFHNSSDQQFDYSDANSTDQAVELDASA